MPCLHDRSSVEVLWRCTSRSLELRRVYHYVYVKIWLMNLPKRLGVITLILVISVVTALLSSYHILTGSDVGGTKGLFSYSNISNGELHYPSGYLRIGTIEKDGGGLCTAVNSLPTKAYGWPFYTKLTTLIVAQLPYFLSFSQ